MQNYIKDNYLKDEEQQRLQKEDEYN